MRFMIITYNIGKCTELKMRLIGNCIRIKQEKYNLDFVIIGFQELICNEVKEFLNPLSTKFSEKTYGRMKIQQLFNLYYASPTILNGDFCLGTLIITQPKFQININDINHYEFGFMLTKGSIVVQMITKYGQFIFSNNHAPFKDTKETLKYFVDLYKFLVGKNLIDIDYYLFIFGDLNARSLILDGTYKKKFTIPNNDDSLIKKVEKCLKQTYAFKHIAKNTESSNNGSGGEKFNYAANMILNNFNQYNNTIPALTRRRKLVDNNNMNRIPNDGS